MKKLLKILITVSAIGIISACTSDNTKVKTKKEVKTEKKAANYSSNVKSIEKAFSNEKVKVSIQKFVKDEDYPTGHDNITVLIPKSDGVLYKAATAEKPSAEQTQMISDITNKTAKLAKDLPRKSTTITLVAEKSDGKKIIIARLVNDKKPKPKPTK